MSNDCSQHKKDLYGHADMKEVAEAIGDLHYETLAELFRQMKRKFSMDAENDLKGERILLSDQLELLADVCYVAELHSFQAWQISKPFMTPKPDNNE